MWVVERERERERRRKERLQKNSNSNECVFLIFEVIQNKYGDFIHHHHHQAHTPTPRVYCIDEEVSSKDIFSHTQLFQSEKRKRERFQLNRIEMGNSSSTPPKKPVLQQYKSKDEITVTVVRNAQGRAGTLSLVQKLLMKIIF